MAKFSDNPTNPMRAVQVWQILIAKAHNRQTMTYTDLATIIGHKKAGVVSNILDYIMRYCALNSLPPLTVLVVGKDRGVPGDGLSTITNADADREAVYNFDWFGIIPPTPEEFDEAHKTKF